MLTLNAISLGVKKVIAKAGNEEQGQVLERLGAEVIYPDKDSADRLAKKILSNNILDFISLNENIEIVERILKLLKLLFLKDMLVKNSLILISEKDLNLTLLPLSVMKILILTFLHLMSLKIRML